MSRILLVRSGGISMPCYRYGDDRRFGRLFRQAWHRLPLGDRRCLLKFWREGAAAGLFFGGRTRHLKHARPDGSQLVHVAPRVELLPFLPSSAGPSAFGFCNGEGSALLFLAPFVDALPDEAVMTLIAHEIAHAYLRAIGVPFFDYDNDDPWNEEEMEVKEIVDCWGFDESGLDDVAQGLSPLLKSLNEEMEEAEEMTL